MMRKPFSPGGAAAARQTGGGKTSAGRASAGTGCANKEKSKMSKIKFEIKNKIGVLSKSGSGWAKELAARQGQKQEHLL
jgi:hypothetical protein